MRPPSGRPSGTGFSRRARIGVTAVVLVLMGIAFTVGLITRGGGEGNPFQPASAVFATVPQALQPASASPGEPVRLGRPISDTEISGPDVSGSGFVTLTTWAGRPVVLVLWSSTCPGCTSGFATTVRTVARLQRGVAFLGISTDRSAAAAAAFVRRNGWTFPSIADPDGALTAAVGATTTPVVVVLGAGHHVAAGLRPPFSAAALQGAIASTATGE